jgi:hypothetical protein
MSLQKASFFICVIISALCLTTGYGVTAQWIGALVSILMVPVWLLARKYPSSWLPPICLLVSVCLAVVGKLTGAPSLLMIFGSGFSLAVWDLISLKAALGSNSSGEQTRQYENGHLRSLALALGSGLLVSSLGRLLNLQIPFIVLMLFTALALFGLDRVWVYIKRAG